MIYEQTRFWRPGLQWAEPEMTVKCTFIDNQAQKSSFFLTLFIYFIVYSRYQNKYPCSYIWIDLPDICLWFKGPIENFIQDISLEFPVIPKGQTKGIVSSLSSCCVIISSDENRRQNTTGSGLCKNSLFVHNIKPGWRPRAQHPEAAQLMT